MFARCIAVLAFCLFAARPATAQEKFPELEPDLQAPAGYALTFRDGPDFYVWRMAEEAKGDDRSRSGFGIYFGLHPSLSQVDKKTAKEIKGTICGQDAVWWVQTSDDPKHAKFRRDARIDYRHGKEYLTLALHIWIWGDTEERVTQLETRLKSLKLKVRAK
jgi:hypothetical protein